MADSGRTAISFTRSSTRRNVEIPCADLRHRETRSPFFFREISSLRQQKSRPEAACSCAMAEAVRFELTDGCPSPVFKTGAIDHSATLPGNSPFYDGACGASGRNSSSTSLSSSQPRGVAAMRAGADCSRPSCSARPRPGCRLDSGMPVRST